MEKQQRYHFDLSFPHGTDELSLFLRTNVNVNGERWGFSNVIVDALPELNQLPDDQKKLDALWKQILSKDPVSANQAVWELIAAGPAGLAFTHKRSGKVTGKELQKKFATAVTGLSSNEFLERVRASTAIQNLGPAALPLIDATLKSKEVDQGARAALTRRRLKIASNQAAPRPEDRLLVSRIAHIERVLNVNRKPLMRATSPQKLDRGGRARPFSVLDGFYPSKSKGLGGPCFTWYPRKVGESWLRIDLGAEQAITELGVFWFHDNWGTNLPSGWKIEYLEADKQIWKAVKNPSNFAVLPDEFNKVTFDKVKTTAVRIVVTFDGFRSAGVHEIYIK